MTGEIFGMLARSPMKPIQQHMEIANKCSKLLLPFFEAVIKEDWKSAEATFTDIATQEKEADLIKREFRLNLPKKGLFLSVPRNDLLEIIRYQDKVANRAEDIAGLVIGRKMVMPKEIEATLLELVSRAIDASKQATKAIKELDELVETGFRGHEVTLVEEMINDLDQIEQDTDNLEVTIRSQLFSIESSLQPIDVMFLYRVIDWIGELADHAEKVGSSLELLLAR